MRSAHYSNCVSTVAVPSRVRTRSAVAHGGDVSRVFLFPVFHSLPLSVVAIFAPLAEASSGGFHVVVLTVNGLSPKPWWLSNDGATTFLPYTVWLFSCAVRLLDALAIAIGASVWWLVSASAPSAAPRYLHTTARVDSRSSSPSRVSPPRRPADVVTADDDDDDGLVTYVDAHHRCSAGCCLSPAKHSLP